MKKIFTPIIRFTKGILMISIVFILLSGISFVIHSCKKDDVVKDDVASVDKATEKFVNAYNQNLMGLATSNLVSYPASRTRGSSDATVSNGDITAYLLYPEGTPEAVKNLYKHVATVQELADLIRLTGATLQYVENEANKNYKVVANEQQLRESLTPMLMNAKQWLYAKGFTEADIQEMIAENDADEIDLIPFVMLLSEAELSQAYSANNTRRKAFNLSDMFFSPSYARDLVGKDYFDCAMKGIGLDFLTALGTANLQTWTLTAIKTSFPKVAARALGLWGVGIAVVTFGWCLYERASEPDCVYSTTVTDNSVRKLVDGKFVTYSIPPPSKIEGEYNEIIFNLNKSHG
ncbi:MAG: hypothetical protein LBS52_02840 [Dysgonamonadaceae bacterium]|jgi:hypothetical protein|nr:hypothetical protein [Dysgonamonadaceae bacterium]